MIVAGYFPKFWSRIPCDMKLNTSLVICLDKYVNPDSLTHNKTLNRRKHECPSQYVLVNIGCVYVHMRVERKMKRHALREFMNMHIHLEHYLTVWRKYRTKLVSINKIIYENNTMKCQYLMTSDMSYQDSKGWTMTIDECGLSSLTVNFNSRYYKRAVSSGCHNDQHSCTANLGCIHQHRVCDGHTNCIHDEIKCDVCSRPIGCFQGCLQPSCFCHKHYFQCYISDGCVHFSVICDGEQNCDDGTDELACPLSQFLGTIHTFHDVCEDGCLMNNMAQQCHRWSKCDYWKCFPSKDICTFSRDIYGDPKYCSNTDHLQRCSTHQCPSLFKCRDSFCVEVTSVCDGIDDCPQGEDEYGCYSDADISDLRYVYY